jgi:hypothetical protein
MYATMVFDILVYILFNIRELVAFGNASETAKSL